MTLYDTKWMIQFHYHYIFYSGLLYLPLFDPILFRESYLAEQFRKITHYLAEQFCQIAHYLAEHLIQKNDILFNEKFLILWMQECKNTGIHTSLRVCKYVHK